MDKIINNSRLPEPDIEVTDDVGKLQFFNLSGRQYQALKNYKRIQQLVKLHKNDQLLGGAIREIIEFGYDESEE
jgi:methyl coenzyme M reductase beta subunit